MPKLFTPTAGDLLGMIQHAEAKFAHDRDQSFLKADTKADARIARVIEMETKARRYSVKQK